MTSPFVRSASGYLFMTLLAVAASDWLHNRNDLAAQEPAPAASSDAQPPADQRDSSPEALAAYGKAATYQNNKAYDLAADAWQTFLKQYKSDPRAVEARYNLGVCYLELKRLKEAREFLQQAISSQDEFGRREDAYLNLGWVLYTLALQDQPPLFVEAEQVFTTMLGEFPKGTHRDQALFLRGESQYAQGKRAEAAESYATVVDDLPESDLMSNSLYALGVAREELRQFEQAGALYDRFLKDFPDNLLVAEVRMRKAETLLQRGELEAAAAGFDEVASQTDFPDADYARYRQAFALARQERFEAAADVFAKIPSDFPKSRYVNDAMIAAGRAYYRADKPLAAQQWFEQLVDVDGPYASEAAHWICRLLLQQKDEVATRQALELVAEKLPVAKDKNHTFFVNLRMDQADIIYELPKRRGETIDLYAAIATEHPDHFLAPQALYNAAFAAMEVQQYQRAVTLANQFVERFPDHRLVADAKHVKAESQLQLGDAQAAADSFTDLATAGGDQADAGKWRLRKAVALYTQQQYRQVLDELAARVDSLTDPSEQAEGLYLIGMSHFALEQFDKAGAAFETSLARKTDWPQADDVLLNLSRTQQKLKQSQRAIATVEQLIERFPESELRDQAHFRLGEYRYAASEYGLALREYNRVLSDWPESKFVPYSLYGRGWSLLRQTDLDDAEAAFTKLLEDHSKHELAKQTWYARAMTRQQAGKFDQSLTDIQKFLTQSLEKNEESDGRYVRALCLMGKQDFPAAIETLREIAQQHAEYGASEKVLYELAWAYKSANQPAKSTAVFRQLTELHPEGHLAIEASYHVGEAAYGQQQYKQAAAAYRSAQERLSDDNSADLSEKVLYKLGWSEYQLGNYDAASAAFADQVARQPDGTLAGDAYFMQGECHFRQQEFAESMKFYGAASKRELSSQQITTLAYLHAGQAAGQLDEWKKSYDWLAALAKKYPESPYQLQIGYELGVAHQNLGNPREAERLFGSVADRGTGELSARARFMFGEVLYARGEHVPAIREFRKVMFGYDASAIPQVARWQAKAGFEAGQCAGILASQQRDRRQRRQYVDLAKKFFQYVVTKHADTEEAKAAKQQLSKYGT